MWIAAADAGGGGDAAILAVYTFLGVVVTQLAFLIAPIIKSRFERTPPTSTPAAAPTDGTVLLQMATVQGAVVQRLDDHDDAIDMVDRARAADREDLDDVLGFLDRNEPDWRGR